MRTANKKVMIFVCLSLIFVMVFALSACDKEGGDEEKEIKMTLEESVEALSNAQIQKDGSHSIDMPYRYFVGRYVENNEPALTYASLNGTINIFKDNDGKYMYHIQKRSGAEYCQLTKEEYNQAMIMDTQEDMIIEEMLKMSYIEDQEDKDKLKDMYYFNIEGTKDGNGGYFRTTTVSNIYFSYANIEVPCDVVILVKLDENGRLLTIDMETTYVEGYKPVNIRENVVNEYSWHYQWVENPQYYKPELSWGKDISLKEGTVSINPNMGNTFADGETLKMINHGETIDLGIPVHEGFTDEEFLGWYADNEYKIKYEDNKYQATYGKDFENLYPKWKQKDNIVIDVDGAKTYSDKEVDTSNIATYFDLLSAQMYKEDYNLEGWYTSETFEEGTKLNIGYNDMYKPLPSNSKFYAHYVKEEQEEMFKVTFKAPDLGYKALDVTIEFPKGEILNESYQIPYFAKENSALVGWYLDEALTQEWDMTLEVTKDMTLYPKYEEGGIKVIYNYPTNEINAVEWIYLPKDSTLDEVIDLAENYGPGYSSAFCHGYYEGLYLEYKDHQYLKDISDLSAIPEDKILNVYVNYEAAQ